jgi:hypothetical protein
VVLTGKLVGSTAVAYGSTRIQAHGSLAAETIGRLMGELHGSSLKKVTPERMASLHRRLLVEEGIQLQPPPGKNIVAGSQDELQELDRGHVTLLADGAVARHLPFVRMRIGDEEVVFSGVRPLIIDGSTWVPLEETFRRLGAADVRADAERGTVSFATATAASRQTIETKLHVWNNHIMIALTDVTKALPYKAEWDAARRVVKLIKK